MRDLLIELQYLFRKDGNQIPNQAVVMGAGSGTDGQKAVDIQHQGLGGGDGYHADVQNGTGRCGVGFRKEAAGFDFGHDIPVPPTDPPG